MCLLKQAQNSLFESAAIVGLERLKLASLGGSTQLTCSLDRTAENSPQTLPLRDQDAPDSAWELVWELQWETAVVVEIVQSVFV